jgi:hypothetical protein
MPPTPSQFQSPQPLQLFPNELPDRKEKQGIFSRLFEACFASAPRKVRGLGGKKGKKNRRTTEEAMRREFYR